MKPISLEPGVYGPNVHVSHQPPDPSMLDRVCESCGEEGCRAVANVRWTNPTELGGTVRFRAGRPCLALVREIADSYPGYPVATVHVDLPTWRSKHLATLAGISYRKVDYWTGERLLIPEADANPGSGAQRLYLADMVERATWMGAIAELSRGGATGDFTCRLLDYGPDARDHLSWIAEALKATVSDGGRRSLDHDRSATPGQVATKQPITHR